MPSKRSPRAIPEELRPYLTGEETLASIKDAKTRRRLTKALATLAGDQAQAPDTVTAAETEIYAVLNGDVRVARTVSGTVNAGKRRDLLPKAWSRSLRHLAAEDAQGDAIRPRATWIAAAAPKLRKLSAEDAEDLLEAAASLLATAERSPSAALDPLRTLIVSLAPKTPRGTEIVTDALLRGTSSVSHRRDVALSLSVTNALGPGLWDLFTEGAVYRVHALGSYVLSRMPGEDRIATLTRILSRSSSHNEAEVRRAADVIEQLCEDAGSRLGDYLDVLMTLAIVHPDMSSRLQQLLTEAFIDGADKSSAALARSISAVVKARTDSATEEIASRNKDLESESDSLRAERDDLRSALEEQKRMTESVKLADRRSAALPEYSGRMSVLVPLCSIHQEMEVVMQREPNKVLLSFSRILQSLIVRQGIKLTNSPGDRVAFNPEDHDLVEGPSVEPGTDVNVIAAGYRYENQELGIAETAVRTAVSSA